MAYVALAKHAPPSSIIFNRQMDDDRPDCAIHIRLAMAETSDQDGQTMSSPGGKPVVLITGAAGSIGRALCDALTDRYDVVGLDIECDGTDFPCLEMDITNPASVELALTKVAEQFGTSFAAVIHLAAYFDFTGKDHPMYQAVNVDGTRHLVRALQHYTVERFIYSGTMLVHEPVKPGELITEEQPIAPKWAYPQSKAAAEEVIRNEAGDMPYTLLHLAGLYDDKTAVPTLSNQIARIYERELKSHVYAGDFSAGQSMLHREDMINAMQRVVDRRQELPEQTTILIGEPEGVSYERLQERIGNLIHGEKEWRTISLPQPLAKLGSAVEVASEPVVPDAIDDGEKPFIRPFMIDMAEDHYALDIARARDLLGWEPKHNLHDDLESLIATLKDDAHGWYQANGITPPPWLRHAEEHGDDGETVRSNHERLYRHQHQQNLWAHFLNMGVGSWLITAPLLMGYETTAMTVSDIVSGIALIIFSFISLSWRMGWARWASAIIGCWLLMAPLVFWAPSALAYHSGTLCGMLAIGLAVLTRPAPGVSAVASQTGPTIPPGWDFSPSDWLQRLPIILLAFIGLHVSRYLAAYQLGYIDTVWEPFFTGPASPEKNGTEEIITSSVSEAWPVPDAGLGAVTYMLEILIGFIGSRQRWRTMPWLVLIFGIMIVPLGAVSITFIIIQPIILDTWCTLCLIAASAMLLQIPYSLDELVATTQFLIRRKTQGHSLLRTLFVGDTDDGRDELPPENEFTATPLAIIKDTWTGGISLPWTLALTMLVGIWLMFTRLTLDSSGDMANAEHLIGAMVLTVAVTAMADVARPVRFLNILFAAGLLIVPFVYGITGLHLVATIVAGIAIILLSLPKGRITGSYGSYSRFIV